MEKKHSSDKNSNSHQIGEDVCSPFIDPRRSFSIKTKRNIEDDLLKSCKINEDDSDLLEICKINESDNPSFPKFLSFEERLKTFKNWPHKSLNLAPDILSAAGLFYTGSKDSTRCFHCSGGLKLFDASDDPWVEHACWYPKCRYILSVRGEKFVEDVRIAKRKDLDSVQEELKSAIGTLKEVIPRNTYVAELINNNSKNEIKESSEESISSFYKSRIMCLICSTEERNVVLLPCYHIVACSKCANDIMECCICREPVKDRCLVQSFLI